MNLSLSLSLSLLLTLFLSLSVGLSLSLSLSLSLYIYIYIYIEWTVSTCHCVHFSGVTITVHSRHPRDFANRWPELGTVTLHHPTRSTRHGGYKAFIKGVFASCGYGGGGGFSCDCRDDWNIKVNDNKRSKYVTDKYNNNDLSRLRYFSPAMRLNTRYINSTRGTASKRDWLNVALRPQKP